MVGDVIQFSGAGSQNFDRRFSTTLSPGSYVLLYQAWGSTGEDTISGSGGQGVNHDASASLNIVLTLSPVGDCSDGLDNDGDTLVDLDDSDCADGTDTSEASSSPPGVSAMSTAGRAVVLTTMLLLALNQLRTRRRG